MSLKKQELVGQEQIHHLLFGDKLSWQSIIYELINTEQLDPWNVDISLLSKKYLERVKEMEEANFFVSSKVLLAASLLLRIKSEILLNKYLPSLDDVLFGRKEEENKYSQERIEFDDDLPELVPRTPLPRMRRVSLEELMSALGKAIKTENRRIKKEILVRQHERETEAIAPRFRINIRDKVKDIYRRLKDIFSDSNKEIAFSELLEKTREDKVMTFVSLLHLDNQQKIWIEQEEHLDEIWIWLHKIKERKEKSIIDLIEKKMEEIEIDTGFSQSVE